MIVQEDPFISLSKAGCVGSLVMLIRASSEPIRRFGILMGANRRARWHLDSTIRSETPSDAPETPVAATEGLIAVTKPVVTDRTPSTGHRTPGPKRSSPETPGPTFPPDCVCSGLACCRGV